MELLEDFKIEALELLHDAEDAFIGLEKGRDPKDVYKVVFRSFHSLKGGAGMMGLDEVQRHMHLLEDYLSTFQERTNELSKQVDYFLQAIDGAKSLLEGSSINFTYKSQDLDIESKENLNALDLLKKMNIQIGAIGQGFSESEFSNILKNLNEYKAKKGWLSSELFITKSQDVVDDVIKSQLLIPILCEGVNSKDQIPSLENLDGATLQSFIRLYRLFSEIVRSHEKCLQLLMFQYVDLEDFLKEQGRTTVLLTLKKEIFEMLDKKQKIIGF
ncbi:MAG: hypothetical protein Fur0010_11650 [Bdellovibrio sp.]